MSQSSSSKYAKSLFELSKGEELDSREEFLNSFVELWSSTPELKNAINNPAISKTERLAVLTEISKNITTDEVCLNLMKVIFENKRMNSIEEISNLYSFLVKEFKKLLQLEVTSAFELNEEEKNEFSQKIEAEFNSSPEISWSIDTNLIGGYLIKAGDKLLDSSIKGKLKKAKINLINQ